MQFRTASMSAMLAITKHGMCVGIIAPCLVNFIMADMEAVQNCISAPREFIHQSYVEMFCLSPTRNKLGY